MSDNLNPMSSGELEADVYVLTDEEGNDKEFELIDIMKEGERIYYAFVPYIRDPQELLNQELELVVVEATTDYNGCDILAPIESDEEYDRLANIFLDRLDEDCDCEEDDCDCCH